MHHTNDIISYMSYIYVRSLCGLEILLPGITMCDDSYYATVIAVELCDSRAQFVHDIVS